jgi:hypothetical protein
MSRLGKLLGAPQASAARKGPEAYPSVSAPTLATGGQRPSSTAAFSSSTSRAKKAEEKPTN